MSLSTEMLKDKLAEAYSRFRYINRQLLAANISPELLLALKKEQQSLLLVQIPRLNAQIRRMAEINGEVEEEAAAFTPEFSFRGSHYICTANSYFIEKEIYWIVNPKIFGKGLSKQEALKDFCRKLQHILDKRHGRPVRIKAEKLSDLKQRMTFK